MVFLYWRVYTIMFLTKLGIEGGFSKYHIETVTFDILVGKECGRFPQRTICGYQEVFNWG